MNEDLNSPSCAICPKYFLTSFIFTMCICFWVVDNSLAAISASAGLDDGYSGRVLDKALKTFSPEQVLGAQKKLSILLIIDGEGKLADCRIRESTGAASVDKAFCASLKKSAPFSTPPYGQPTEVTLTFVASDKTAVPSKQMAQQAEPAVASNSLSSQEKQKYITAATREIRNSVYIPAETKKGIYHPVARIKINSQGKILSSEILKTSGDKTLDKYLLQGIKRAGQISAPPAGLAHEIDLPFSLTR